MAHSDLVITENAFPYSVSDKTYKGLWMAAQRQPRAAAVLLPDWRGQSALAREHARFLAAQDCVMVIADIYGGGFNPTSPDQVSQMVQQLVANRNHGVAALAACVAALRQKLAGIPVFCLGYSAGGMIALDYGRSGADIAGIILCSALLKTALPGQSTRIAAPVLFLQGTQDVVSPMAVIDQLVAEMDAAGNDFRFVLLGQTHHAFDNPEAGTDPAARLCYSPASAKLARTAIEAFLIERIGGG